MAFMTVMRGIAQPQEHWQLRSEVMGSTLSDSQIFHTFTHFNKPLVNDFTAKYIFQDNQY